MTEATQTSAFPQALLAPDGGRDRNNPKTFENSQALVTLSLEPVLAYKFSLV
ncbi:hypothetical protein [Coleofasciculus sp. H7-2]|uniref:hypothetical protein n=1 Tax=Coleofasciculus sp. H7-2 TaxID=3351545 RepID=UPI00366AFC4B